MNINEIIKYPILTEKSYSKMNEGVYVFAVDRRTNRSEVKKAVEFIFDVKVEKVNIFNVPKKATKLGRFKGFTNSYKKAIVKLVEGQTIAILNEDVDTISASEENNLKVEETKKEVKTSKSAEEVAKKVSEKLAKK
ncbi:50S ribosomal protein L23 [Mesomycoplasma molare]|uniref:Large ribosomal subunit protein uL23 n=1 Tax=Mesomycoplasma molare TaxID=171288 RepID=A0ABY5TWD4_9BACT|nr:50S ribosomal protein L23 [Mesomycoplasma molare]UWD34291.1 50S ribosomal protein L23 [Mesomycoplasma molare]